MLQEFINTIYGLVTGINSLWQWLITPIEWVQTLTGLSVAPIALMGVTTITIGIVRAIIGVV